jgi:hypothetical protein
MSEIEILRQLTSWISPLRLPEVSRARLSRCRPLEHLRGCLFWMVGRTSFALYRWFPLFGTLRASIAIIQRNQQFLVIQRNDGRGLSLPGRIASWKEAEEETLRREALEETGLQVTGQELRMHYLQHGGCALRHFGIRSAGYRRPEEFLGRIAAVDDDGGN